MSELFKNPIHLGVTLLQTTKISFEVDSIIMDSILAQERWISLENQTFGYLGCAEFSELFKNHIHLGVTLLETTQNQF